MTRFIPSNTLPIQEAAEQACVTQAFVQQLIHDLKIFSIAGHVSTAAVPCIKQWFHNSLKEEIRQ